MTFSKCTKPLDQDKSGWVSYKITSRMKVTYITSRTQNSFHFTALDSLLVDDHSSFARAEAIMFTIFHLLFLAYLAAKSFTGLIVFNSYMIF